MLAAKLYGIRDIRLEEISIPVINDDEVLLKVRSSAICGTDIRIFNNGLSGVDQKNPRILGHEVSGVIAQTGRNVKGYKEGMRVAVAPNTGCGICEHCVRGNTHLCNAYKALGINTDGGFAEYVRIPAAAVRQGNMIELDDNISFDEAAINEPFSCVYNGFLKCGIKPGDSILVIGAGPIGILHAKLAKMAGASVVIINDLSQERLDICKRIDNSFLTVSGNLKDEIMKITRGRGLDVCITACPAPQAQSGSLELMSVGGRINFFGGLPKDRENVTMNTNIIHYKQLVITGSTRASVSQFRKTLEFISSGVISVKEIVSQRFTLDRIKEGFEMAGNANGLKNVIYFE